jgi:hypothetical protein
MTTDTLAELAARLVRALWIATAIAIGIPALVAAFSHGRSAVATNSNAAPERRAAPAVAPVEARD